MILIEINSEMKVFENIMVLKVYLNALGVPINDKIYKVNRTATRFVFEKKRKLSFSHCVKIVQIRIFFSSVFSCIQSEYTKIQARKNSVFGHFSKIEKCSPNIL